MSYRENLLTACKTFCDRTGKTTSTAGNLAANDGKFFERLEAGGSCTMATYEKVMGWFKDNTPEQPVCP